MLNDSVLELKAETWMSDVEQSVGKMLVYFWAPWCGHCCSVQCDRHSDGHCLYRRQGERPHSRRIIEGGVPEAYRFEPSTQINQL